MAAPPEKELDLGPWTVTEELAQQYLRAVGDTSPIYLEAGLAPPVALAAYTLGALLQQLTLPPGTIHSLQELETQRPVRFGDTISGVARLGRPKLRGEYQFMTISYTLANTSHQQVLTGKSTVLVPRSETFTMFQGKPNLATGE